MKWKEIRAVFKDSMGYNEAIDKMQEIYNILDDMYPNRKTLKTRLSQIRNIIKENQEDRVYQASKLDKYFNIPEATRNKITTDYVRETENKNKNMKSLHVDDIAKNVNDLLNSRNIEGYELGALLMMVSGMRPLDLFINEVKIIKRKPSWIRMTNLAKKRVTGTITEIVRPIIYMSAKEFTQRLKDFRKYFIKGGINVYTPSGQIAGNISHNITEAVRRVFKQVGKAGQASAMLRKFYVAIAYDIHGDKSAENFNVFIKRILGHEDITTSFAYSWISLKYTDKPAPLRRRRPILKQKPKPKEYVKLQRTASRADKLELLNKIYNDHDGIISNSNIRKLSGMGSRIVNEFLKSKRV